MVRIRSAIRDAATALRTCWWQLVVTDVIYKIVALIVLTPLTGILLRILIATSGEAVLSDQDILYFFLGPVGWLCFITIGALWIGIIAVEQAALMAILASVEQQPITVLGALRFARVNAWHVTKVTGRMVAFVLLVLAPFLLAAAAAYYFLLREFDINYYLQEKPPEFLWAVGIAGGLVAVLVAILLWFVTGWFFAIPIAVFEDVRSMQVLRTSRERAYGHRRTIVIYIIGWLVLTTVCSAIATAAVIGLGHFFVPRATGSLALLAVAIGVTMILWTVVNLAVHLLSTISFSTLLYKLYRQIGSNDDAASATLNLSDATESGPGIRLTRPRLLAGSIVGILLAVTVGFLVMRSVRLVDQCEIIAHRGASAAAPENTMAAVKRAIEDGADWVEIDVQETADGEIVVFHDSDFMKLAGNKLRIWDATMADLKEIDIGSWFNPRFKDERVPTLAQVLQACKGKAGVNIELKYYGHDRDLEKRVIQNVEENDMASEVVIMSLKMDAVNKMKSLRPDWKVGLLMSVAAGDTSTLNVDFLVVNTRFADRSFIRSTHKNGKQVITWTVNDAPTMSIMIGRRVNGLITDEPALARTVLKQRALLSAPERLLLELAGMLGVVPDIGEQ